MSIGLLGKKKKMTRVYDEKGNVIPVTIIEVGGNFIFQVKSKEKDGYSAIQVGFDDQKKQRLNKPKLGHFAKQGGGGSGANPKKFIREFRLEDHESVPEDRSLLATQFEVGQFVDVIGQSKGKGFQGVMKRHNFSGQPASHGSMTHRRNGAIGNRSTPGRVWKNMGMPGHMGDERVTVQNLIIIQVREKEGFILVSGAVPGPNDGYVIVRPAKKKTAKKEEAKNK